ncbi:ATP-dependent DNA ligase [Venturia nashicola]|uniref:DNA ligase n=1 Tax=Venturia nashicola TaxID=86259 RepID=A0A4Z1P935_9PEZI|nr:ATP-dependent DNA ligase [Venturia nashicola]
MSKQGTLKYVLEQQTLGKFFGKANDAKPAVPQQSKLSFSTNPKTKAREDKVEEEDEEPAVNTEKEKQEGGDEVMEEGEPEPVKAKFKSPTPTNLKKRTVSPDEKSAPDEEEPPAKKQRTKGRPKKTEVTKDTKPTKDITTKAVKKELTSKASSKVREEKDGPTVKATQPKAKGRSKKVIEDEDEEMTAPPASTKSPAGSSEDAEDDVDEVASEPEAESEDEEEKPEMAAKMRKKVAETLQATSKDLYPDWKAGDPVPYAALCATFSKIEMTTKRLEIAAHCNRFLQQVLRLTPDDLLPTVLLMINKLAADYSGIELGIGESLIMKAIGESTGRSVAVIKKDQNEIGDLGMVAAKSRGNQPTMFKPKALTVRGVHKSLIDIAIVEGSGSQGRKVDAIKKILSAADVNSKAGKVDITKDRGGPSEAKFIVRTLEGKLRLGLAEKTVLVALAQALVFHEVREKSGKVPSTEALAKGETTLKSVYSELPSYEVIIPAILAHGLANLHENCKLQPGVPLKPMLAKPTKSITEVLDRFDGKDFTCEYKYDGERAQIHFVAHDSPMQYATTVPQAGNSDKGIANVFSRNSEDLSKKYPDILAKLPSWVKDGTKSFVMDCEAVAWDVTEKKVLPFQQLMTRKRKDVKVEDIKVKVCVFAFDLLFLNGEALVNKSFRERREKLHSAFNETEGEFAFAKHGDGNQLDEIQVLLEESVKEGCEGLMVKMLDGIESNYEPSRRSQNWLKVKKDYLSGVGDSLDLVVLGAYFGRGKRTSWYGAFLLACYNPSKQTYETVCNIGTGFSEEILAEFHKQLSEIVIEKPKPFYEHSTGNKDQPDVWFEPKFVWEVKTADLTLSPRYRAAAGVLEEGGKGISLRFPRFIKIRDDKKPGDATSNRQVAEMYSRQESVGKNKGPSVDDDFEY